MQGSMRIFVAFAVVATWTSGCSCDAGGGVYTWDGITPDTFGDGSGDTYGDGTDPFADVDPATMGTVTGVVYSPASPSAQFPISGALVYVTKTEPAPIAAGVYCHTCVEMPATVPHAFSAANGSFTITNVPAGNWLLVVQKGEFRRVRYIDVVGETVLNVTPDLTTFPDSHHPEAGDSTPSIAVALGSYDDLQDILAKIGLCDLDSEQHAILDTCDHIDFYDNGGSYGSDPTFESLLENPALMANYHIIFVPCSNSTTDAALSNATIRQNVRDWVTAGGKWYVADWSYDHVEQIFPEFLGFEGDDGSIGDADMASGSFDTTGRAVNSDLRAWLQEALTMTPDSVEFKENWDCIDALGAVPATDPDGTPITITPEVYCEGPITRSHACMSPAAPLTMTFPYGCGKVLFTTYHTVGEMVSSHVGLEIQEKILVYLILEIGLCTAPVVII